MDPDLPRRAGGTAARPDSPGCLRPAAGHLLARVLCPAPRCQRPDGGRGGGKAGKCCRRTYASSTICPRRRTATARDTCPSTIPCRGDAPPHHTWLPLPVGHPAGRPGPGPGRLRRPAGHLPPRAGRSYIAHHRTTCFSNFYAGDTPVPVSPKGGRRRSRQRQQPSPRRPRILPSTALGDGSIRLQAPKDGIQIDTDAEGGIRGPWNGWQTAL